MKTFQESKAVLQTKAKNGNIHESIVYTEISKLFSEAEKLQIENAKLKSQNELYRLLQDNDEFVFLDGMADRPWTNEEMGIINRHNAKFAGQFRQTEDGKLEFVDGIGRITEVKTSIVGDPIEFVLPGFPEKANAFNPDSVSANVRH